MVYEMNDLKGILILVFFSVPMIASVNINCKAFHCVNSTHFMICVDLGGGLSTTIDDFVIPCPATTVCHENNNFECDFPKVETTTSSLEVIGVYKQSDTSEPALVTDSVTAATPVSEITSVFDQNVTATTLSIPEEETSILKLEVLKDIKQPVGFNSENSTETSFLVNSTFINAELNNSNTVTTPVTDDIKHLRPTVKSSIPTIITTSVTDKTTPKDTVTSVIELINLISTDPQSIVSTESPFGVLTTLNIADFLKTRFSTSVVTTTDQYTTNQVESITEKLITPTGTTLVANRNIENDVNKTMEHNEIDSFVPPERTYNMSNGASEVVLETIESLAPIKIDNISETVNLDVSLQKTANNTIVPLGLANLKSTNHLKNITSTSLSFDYTTVYDDTSTTIAQQGNDKPITKETNITILNLYSMNNHSFKKDDIKNNTYIDSNSNANISTVKIESNPIGHYFKSTTVVLSTATEKISHAPEKIDTSRDIFNGEDSLVENRTIVTQPLETTITTESIQEVNLPMISIKNKVYNIINTTEEIKIASNVYTTDISINNGTEPNIFHPTTTQLSTKDIVTTESLKQEFTLQPIPIDIKIELPASYAPISFNDPYTENDPVLVTDNVISATPVSDMLNDFEQVTATTLPVPDEVGVRVNSIILGTKPPVKVNNEKKTETNFPVSSNLINENETNHTNTITASVTDNNNNLFSTEKTSTVTFNDPYMENVQNVTVLSLYTTPTPYNLQPDLIIKDWAIESHVVTNKTTDTTSNLYTYLSTEAPQKPVSENSSSVTSNLEPVMVDTIIIDDGRTSNKQNDTTDSYNVGKIVTTEYPHDITNKAFSDSITPTTGNREEKLVSNVIVVTETPINTNLSQNSLLNNFQTLSQHTSLTEINTNATKTNDTASIGTDFVKSPGLISTNISETTDIYTTSTTVYEFDISTTFLQEIINFEKTTDLTIAKTLSQEASTNKNNASKQFNIPSIGTESISKFVPSNVTPDGHIELNANDKDSSIVYLSNSKNNNSTKISPFTTNTNKNESIKILSLFDNGNSSLSTMPNGTMQPSSSNPYLSDYSNKTTKTQDSSVYVTTDSVYDFLRYEKKNTRNVEEMPKTTKGIIAWTAKPYIVLPTTRTPSLATIVNNTLSRDAPLPNANNFDITNSTKVEFYNVTKKINDYISSREAILTQLNKPPIEEAGIVSTASDFRPKTTSAGIRIAPVSGDEITTKTNAAIMSNNPKSIENSSVLILSIIERQTIANYDKVTSRPITEVPSTLMTTVSPHITNTFAQTQIAAIGQQNIDILFTTKTTTVPHYTITTIFSNIPQSTTDVSTSKTTKSANSEGKMRESVSIPSDMTPENRTLYTKYNNEFVKTIFYPEKLILGGTSVNVGQNKTISSPKAKNINKSEIVVDADSMHSIFNVSSIKLKYSSIAEELTTESSILKSVTDRHIKILPTNFPIDAQTSSNINDYELVATQPLQVKKPQLLATENIMKIETIIANNENKKVEIDSSVNANIEIFDVNKYQVRPDPKNVSDNISYTKANLTTLHSNLSLYDGTLNDKLQHITSTNHTITTQVQSQLSEDDKQINKADVVRVVNKASSEHNSSLTSLQSDAGRKEINVTVSSPLFNCSNYTRGKYSDKKDCRKFYTCIGNLQPIIGICPNNTVFSEINKQCTRNLSHCVRNNQFRCLFQGRFSDFFKDNIYYICVKNSISTFIRYKLQCQSDYHLNKDTVKCEKNEDISIQSVSSGSEINNDESKPQIEAKKIVNKDVFECEKEGQFSYPNDCRKYYICTKIKNVYRQKIKICANDEVYDKKQKKCVESDSGEC